jgi:hypothetical protein
MGKLLLLLSVAAAALLVVPGAVSAGSIWSCSANGTELNSFYTNDTVYVCASNITANVSGPVNVYIIADTSTWTENMTLNDVSIGYHAFVTNSTGDLPPTAIWAYPTVGSYDLVADVDGNGTYNSSDFVDSTSATGFSVALQPWSTILFEAGSHSPVAHDWDATNSTDNVMMQVKVTAYESEDIRLDSLILTASGSGDDKAGVSYVKVVNDADGDGVIDATETHLVIDYVMSGTAATGDTFKVQLTSAGGVGANTGVVARVSGLPLDSQTATVTGAATTTTILSGETTTTLPTTTTTSASTTTTQPPEEEPGITNYLLIASVCAAAAVCIAVAVYLLTRKRGQLGEYTYGDLEKKWGRQ